MQREVAHMAFTHAKHVNHNASTIITCANQKRVLKSDVSLRKTMEWIQFLEVASKDLDKDGPLLRTILDDIKQFAHCTTTTTSTTKEGYRLDSQAQFAMGWWFFAVYVQQEFVKNAVEYMHAKDPKARDERALLQYIRHRLKEQNSTATIKFHSKRSIFTKYWTWLMR